jgi:hypothetical protein
MNNKIVFVFIEFFKKVSKAIKALNDIRSNACKGL